MGSVHEHAFPMRWADLDLLNHVNNVVYLDYAAESRSILTDDGLLDGTRTITDITVLFKRPMLLSDIPVMVSSRIGTDTLEQQICADLDDDRIVFAEVVTRFGQRRQATSRPDVPSLPIRVRRSDLDASGAVKPAKVFELFQEARIAVVSTRLGVLTPGSFVVGTCQVTLRASVSWRSDPYVVGIWVARVGQGSFEMRAELRDERQIVLAESTTALVGFDPTTQRSRPFDEHERAEIKGLLRV